MKTAISIPDKLFKKAEKTAKLLGLSRSNFYQKAIEEYLETVDPKFITAKLNQIYSSENSNLEKDILNLQISSIKQEKWK